MGFLVRRRLEVKANSNNCLREVFRRRPVEKVRKGTDRVR